jgi:hypothetical protein
MQRDATKMVRSCSAGLGSPSTPKYPSLNKAMLLSRSESSPLRVTPFADLSVSIEEQAGRPTTRSLYGQDYDFRMDSIEA